MACSDSFTLLTSIWDGPRAGLDKDPDSPADEIRQAPRRAFENLVKLAIDEEVRFVLLAGDIFDGDSKDFASDLFLHEQLSKLVAANIPTFLIAGNHDALHVRTRQLHLPDKMVTRFSARRPETAILDEIDVAIHGQSFAKAAVTDDLSENYPMAKTGLFNIGMLHTCATKSGEHERYAPCTVDGLRRKEYDYWALGHIHKRENLHSADDACPIVFPGNLQGRHVRESGAKGCMVVTVDDQRVTELRFQPLDVLRWELCEVDVEGMSHAEDVIEKVASTLSECADQHTGLPLAVRVELTGRCDAHRALTAEPNRWLHEIKSVALQTGTDIWIEKVKRRTTAATRSHRTSSEESDSRFDLIDEFIVKAQADPQILAALSAELNGLERALPPELTEGDESLRLKDPDQVRDVLDDVRQIVSHRLLAGEVAR